MHAIPNIQTMHDYIKDSIETAYYPLKALKSIDQPNMKLQCQRHLTENQEKTTETCNHHNINSKRVTFHKKLTDICKFLETLAVTSRTGSHTDPLFPQNINTIYPHDSARKSLTTKRRKRKDEGNWIVYELSHESDELQRFLYRRRIV